MDAFSKAYAKPSEILEVTNSTIIQTNIAIEIKKSAEDNIVFPSDENTTVPNRNNTYDWLSETGSHIQLLKKSFQGGHSYVFFIMRIG